METEAPYFTWRRTSGAAPDAVKAARPVLNGGREETCRKVTRLAPTQRRGGGDQTRHLDINRTTSRPLKKGRMFPKSALRALCASPRTIPPACSPQHGASQDVSGVYSTATLGEATGAESTASESARGSGHRPAPPVD